MFPSRKKFKFDPAPSDNQLWAIGMITVQWTITERLMDDNANAILSRDRDALKLYAETARFKNRRKQWTIAAASILIEPFKSELLKIAGEIAQLQNLRDDAIHGMYGRTREAGTDNAHGGMLRNISHVKGIGNPKLLALLR